MSATFGPDGLPYPQPSDAPDGPGAFLAFAQRLQVAAIGVFDTYANMTAAWANGRVGQLNYVYNDGFNIGYWQSTGSSWVIWSRPWIDYTPSTSGLTLGSGGSTLYAKYKVSNGELATRVGWRLGTSPTINDVNLTFPLTVGSWLNDLAPIGSATFYDSSSGTSGRFRGSVYKTATAARVVYETTGAQMLPVGPTVPFTWAINDEIHIEAKYPI